MTNFPILLTPGQFPVWATDSGRTLDPDDTIGLPAPAEILKENGWDLSQRPPARVMNWLHNLNYGWAVYNMKRQVSNWSFNDYATKPTLCYSVIYNSGEGKWYTAIDNGLTAMDVYESYDGHNWALDDTISDFPYYRSIAIDSSNLLVGTDAGVWYRPNATGTWAQITGGTIGTSDITTLTSKYDTSDLVVVYDSVSGVVYRELTGITGGSWVAASTQPPAVPTGAPGANQGNRLIWTSGSNFYLLATGAGPVTKVYTSADDGDTWAALANHPFAINNCHDMAYNPDTGTLVTVGVQTGDGAIKYTHDAGATAWQSGTIDQGSLAAHVPLISTLRTVYYCGSGVWVAGGQGGASTAQQDAVFIISVDDGETWAYGLTRTDLTVNNTDVTQIAGCPRFLVAITDDGTLITSSNAAYTL